MEFVRGFVRLKPAGLSAPGLGLALAFALSGCQSGDTLGALNIGGGQNQPPAEQETVTVEELRAYCPAITLADDRAVHDSYQRGGDGDASKLVFRAAITEATRSCTYGNGMLGMAIGVAGRVIPGPSGTPGAVRLPIRIAVYQDTAEIYSQRIEHDVAVDDTAGATQFIVVDRNFSMPSPTSRNVRVLVGFDYEARR